MYANDAESFGSERVWSILYREFCNFLTCSLSREYRKRLPVEICGGSYTIYTESILLIREYLTGMYVNDGKNDRRHFSQFAFTNLFLRLPLLHIISKGRRRREHGENGCYIQYMIDYIITCGTYSRIL